MTQYRIHFWQDGCKFTTVIGASNYDSLRKMLKKRYNRFKVEVIDA